LVARVYNSDNDVWAVNAAQRKTYVSTAGLGAQVSDLRSDPPLHLRRSCWKIPIDRHMRFGPLVRVNALGLPVLRRRCTRSARTALKLIPRQWKVIQHVREKSRVACTGRSRSHQLPRIRSRAAAPVPSANTACICRSTGRATPSLAKASRSTFRRWPTGWAYA
jgi:hypothetical protein